MTTFSCKIDERWMGSLESASISITTPKGTYLRIDKWEPARLQYKWSENEDMAQLVWKVYEASKEGKIELTKEEILLWHKYSHLQGEEPHKPKPQFPKRPAQASPAPGKCECGGELKEKDHGTWIGWFCPKCGAGGSRSKYPRATRGRHRRFWS